MVRTRWRHFTGRISILTLLTIIGCIACFIAAFAQRKQHIARLENLKYVYFPSKAPVRSNADYLPIIGPIFQNAELKYVETLSIGSNRNQQYDYLRTGLKNCQALKGLQWSNRILETSDIDSLVGLPILAVLNFSRVKDCSELCRRVHEMPNLQVLTFSDCEFPEENFRKLQNATSVEVIVFKKCQLTNEQVHWLRERLPNTFVVQLDGN